MTAQAWCSRAVRVGFSAAHANVLAAASATAATVMILTRARRPPVESSGWIKLLRWSRIARAERKHLMISF